MCGPPFAVQDESRAGSWDHKEVVSKQACNLPLTTLYLQLFWEHACLHQKWRILSLRRLSQDLGFGFSSRIILEPALSSPNW